MRRGILIAGLSLLSVLTVFIFLLAPPITLKLLELGLNQTARDFFAGTIRIDQAEWKPGPAIHLKNLKGKLQTSNQPVAIEIQAIESQASIFDYFSNAGLILKFKGARPTESSRKGLDGIIAIRGGKGGFFELRAETNQMDLEDLVWVNPENLSGSQGDLKGEIAIRQNANEEIHVRGRFHVKEPGGKLPARFFDLIKPYLPAAMIQGKVEEIRARGGLVQFNIARLEMEMENPGQMKIFLHLSVPDYNLDLHLKMEVRF